eukprot:GFUD01025677.1.p1 GENE.GFUD01025677.1~~GFUD01025677.1.p1  ORF type:complete len:631 (+),score=206.98 GFUD01025677.1:45-1937(+)
MDEGEISRSRAESSEKVVTFPHPPSPSPSHHPRPPNRVKHEQQMELLVGFIGKAEAERGGLVNRVRIKRDQLAEVREERERVYRDKARVFEQLEWVNKEVRQKGDLVQKLRSGLSYGRIDEIEEQVKRLELQLARNTFKLPEERRLVGEIDRLKRSKRILIDYNRERDELERLREVQKVARDEREEWFRSGREARGREDQFRVDLRQLLDKMEECKKQAEELRVEKRTLLDDYRSQENIFRTWQSERRAEQKRRTELERAQAAHEAAAELAEFKATCEPLLAERQLCSALLQYCEKLTGSCSAASTPGDIQSDALSGMFLTLPAPPNRRRSSGFSTNSGCSSHYGTPLGCTPATTPLSGSPPISIDAEKPGFYKKKDDTEMFFAGSRKKNKKCRSERRMSLKKGLTHNPEIFIQFSSLGLTPPPSMANVGEVMKQLREKLNLLEVQAAEIKLARLNVAHDDIVDVDGKTNNIPEIKVESKSSAPPIFIIEPATPDPEVALQLPKVLVEHPPPKYKRNGLTLDLHCPVIPEIAVDNIHQDVTRYTPQDPLEENAIVIIEPNHNGDSKSPNHEITACDKAISNDKFSKPIRGDTNRINNVPSPERETTEGPYAPNCTILAQNPQQLLLANNL